MKYAVDLHCHTIGSPDGSLTEQDVRKMLDDTLSTIAITDHDTISEAQRLAAVFGDAIIVGEEITTSDGEIIGLYLQESISPGLSAVDTVSRIKDQGGLVYIPHPFEKVRKGLQPATLTDIAQDVDIIEVVNGRSFSAKARKQAVLWATQNNTVTAASSDAHGRHGWGRVYSQIDELPRRDTLVTLLQTATLYGSRNGVVSYGYPKLNRLRKKFTR